MWGFRAVRGNGRGIWGPAGAAVGGKMAGKGSFLCGACAGWGRQETGESSVGVPLPLPCRWRESTSFKPLFTVWEGARCGGKVRGTWGRTGGDGGGEEGRLPRSPVGIPWPLPCCSLAAGARVGVFNFNLGLGRCYAGGRARKRKGSMGKGGAGGRKGWGRRCEGEWVRQRGKEERLCVMGFVQHIILS